MAAAFLSGITAAMFLVAGLFFLKFWRASKNRFFALFAGALGLFALERILNLFVVLLLSPEIYQQFSARGWVYLLRLAGFVLIFIAIVDRNRRQRSSVAREL